VGWWEAVGRRIVNEYEENRQDWSLLHLLCGHISDHIEQSKQAEARVDVAARRAL